MFEADLSPGNEDTRPKSSASLNRNSCWASRLRPPGKRSEGKTTTDYRGAVVVAVIGHAGSMRDGDGQAAVYVGIRNSRETVETLGEVMIHIERSLVQVARARTAETG